MTVSTVGIEEGQEFAPRGFGPITMTDIVRYQARAAT